MHKPPGGSVEATTPAAGQGAGGLPAPEGGPTRGTSRRTIIGIVAGVGACCVASLVRFTPLVWFGNYRKFSGRTTEGARIPLLLAQLRDPVHWDRLNWHAGSNISSVLANGNALRWRLLPPVVGRLLHLPPRAYLALPVVGVALLIALVCRYVYRETREARATVATVSLLTTSSAFFVGTGWMTFDPFYLIGLVAFSLSPSTAVMLAACALTPWIDERFLLLLPAFACVRWVLWPERRGQLWTVAAILPYVAVRVAALAMGDNSLKLQLAFQTVSLPDELRYCITYLPLGLLEAFRTGWVVLLAGAALVWSRCGGRPERLALGGAALAGLGAVYFLAWDSSRSTAVLLPLLVLGSGRPRIRRWLPWLAVANLVLPAAHVFGDAFMPLHSLLGG